MVLCRWSNLGFKLNQLSLTLTVCLYSGVLCRNTDPLLPTLVEGLSLVHAVPVATVAAAVPVVTEVSILVAEVATVTTSLVILETEKKTQNVDDASFMVDTNTGYEDVQVSGSNPPVHQDGPCFHRGSCCLHLLCSCSLCALGHLCSCVHPWVPCYPSSGRPWGIRPGWEWDRHRGYSFHGCGRLL